ncbi:MAG: DUF302 domain-containing protein [Deltaproteobacteria bacterium]|nr:DUF302 domain-containing protein [Deltaproteobacteria bacterium]
MTSSSIRRVVHASYDATLARVAEVLKSEGFGVLTEIDMQSTLKAKLGVDFRKYKILGACNPPLALEALTADLEIGLMLPCNVVVYEESEGTTVVMAIDPTTTIATGENPTLVSLAETVKAKLTRALDQLS